MPFEGRRHYLGDGDPAYGRYYDEGVLERSDRFLEEHGFIPEAGRVELVQKGSCIGKKLPLDGCRQL